MQNKYIELLKNIGYLAIGNFASKILVFLLVPVYTSVLTSEEYGIYDAIMTTMQILTPLLIANISDGLMRFLLDKDKDKNQIIRICNKYLTIGVFLLAGLLILNLITPGIDFINGYELYAFLYGASYIIYTYLTQYAKGLNKVSVMAAAGVMSTVIMVGLNLLFLIVLKLGIKGFFLANIFGLIIPIVYYILVLKPWKFYIVNRLDRSLERDIVKYSLPLIFNTIGWIINSSIDKYCVIYFYGVAVSGVLAVAYKIPTIISIIYQIFTQAWQISAVKSYNSEKRNAFYSDTFLFVNAIACVFCSFLLLINKFISKLLFNNEFYEAWRFVPFLLLSVLFNQTAGFVGPLLSAKKESNAMAKAAVWGIVSGIILNILFAKIFGVLGVTAATAISSFVIYFVRWWFARDLLNDEIYPYLYSSWFLVVCASVFEVHVVSRIPHLVIMFLILLINKDQLLKISNIFYRKKQSLFDVCDKNMME